MKASTAKENILKKIRSALSEPVSIPFSQSEGASSVFANANEEHDVEFAQVFTKLQGRFIFCINSQELAFQLSSLVKKSNWEKIYCTETALQEMLGGIKDRMTSKELATCDAAITTCEYLVARTGSIVLSSAGASGRNASVYAPIHICIAYTHQMTYDIKDALLLLQQKYPDQLPSLITFASGPSRTADIEKTLIVGVHGPKEVYLFLVED